MAQSYHPTAVVKFRILAYVNYGRWVVSCDRCPWADDSEPHTPLFFCRECGHAAEIEWPSPEMVYGIARLLLMRPDRTKQNWLPGETLVDLMVENAAHGLFTELPDAHSSLIVDPERIRVDTLPPTFRRELRAIA